MRQKACAGWRLKRYHELWRRREGAPIITSVSPGISSDSFTVGEVPGSGTFFCASCGSQLSLRENDQLPDCPRCGATEFQRDSIFEPMQEHGQTSSKWR